MANRGSRLTRERLHSNLAEAIEIRATPTCFLFSRWSASGGAAGAPAAARSLLRAGCWSGRRGSNPRPSAWEARERHRALAVTVTNRGAPQGGWPVRDVRTDCRRNRLPNLVPDAPNQIMSTRHEATGHQQDINRTSTGHQQDINRTSTGHQQDINRTSTGHQQDINRTSTGHQQDINRECAG